MGESLPAVTAVKQRILQEMIAEIGKNETDIGGGWKVLILDNVTTSILNSVLKMSDLVDCQVSVVENLNVNREPLHFHAIYFITPTKESVDRLCKDFATKTALYPAVHIFFSSRAGGQVIELIKKAPMLTQRLRTLKEANLEFMTVDSHTFTTFTPEAMTLLMGERADTARQEVELCLETIVTRLSTLFATLKEYPTVRYRQKPPEIAADVPGADARGILCQRLATRISDRLTSMQRASQLPARETCDLLVLDRSYDPIAPVAHAWTYEALAFDLLPLEDNTFKYNAELNAGKKENKEAQLSEADELWCELRHQHMAKALTVIQEKMLQYQKDNKQPAGKGSATSTADLKAMIAKAAPDQRERVSRMYLHHTMVTQMTEIYHARKLMEVSEMEQDLVFGQKNSKDLISFLLQPTNVDLTAEDKMRLFLCYLATHPGRLDASTRTNWMKVARLSADDINAVANLAFLNVMVTKAPAAKSMFGSTNKPPKECRTLKEVKEDDYKVGLIEPLLVDVLDTWAKGKLSQDQYPYVRAPAEDPSTAQSAGKAVSARQNKGKSWVPSKATDTSTSSAPSTGGKRKLIVFIVGGATRSEMCAVHKASKALNREVLLVSTSIDTPNAFLDNMRKISIVSDAVRP